MIEVAVTRITADPDDDEITALDKRLRSDVWMVPVIYELEDGCTVATQYKVHGPLDNARKFLDALPMVPTFPTRCVFDDNDELVSVVRRMVEGVAI